MINTGIALSALGFLLYFGIVLLLLRYRQTEPVVLVIATAFAVCFMSLLVAIVSNLSFNFWEFAVSYWFFVLCFLMIFGALYKSISLRILLDLSRMPDQSESYNNLFERYVAGESFRNRLALILDKQYATCANGFFALTERGRRLAGIVRSIQKVFGIEKSG